MTQQYPLVGNAVWIRKDGKVMLAKRSVQKKAGAGTWCPTGGHLEMFETLEECAVRETLEESGVEIANIRLINFMEDPAPEFGTHYLTFHYVADWKSGEPRPQEGESEEWDWFEWNSLPSPLFRPVQFFVDLGINPLELKG
jgi:8-oxo-dGTP diphosphatase